MLFPFKKFGFKNHCKDGLARGCVTLYFRLEKANYNEWGKFPHPLSYMSLRGWGKYGNFEIAIDITKQKNKI